jgi:hypothetical protein
MPRCLNDQDKRYTGNENTPRGRGYAASAEKDGKRMKGADGKMYQAKGNRWVLIKKNSLLSPMSKRKKVVKKATFEDEYDSIDDYSSSEDEDWKYEAAEERTFLSNFFCKEALFTNVALLSWSYFKDWYNRVRFGQDPYQAYEDVRVLEEN